MLQRFDICFAELNDQSGDTIEENIDDAVENNPYKKILTNVIEMAQADTTAFFIAKFLKKSS